MLELGFGDGSGGMSRMAIPLGAWYKAGDAHCHPHPALHPHTHTHTCAPAPPPVFSASCTAFPTMFAAPAIYFGLVLQPPHTHAHICLPTHLVRVQALGGQRRQQQRLSRRLLHRPGQRGYGRRRAGG